MRVVSFKVEEELLEQLDRYTIMHGLNRSEAIRKAIELLIKSNEEVEKYRISVQKIKLF